MELTKMKAADLRLKIYKEMVGKTILDRYELIELIGFGGMGAVFSGVQRAINRTVAIKVLPRLDPLTAARFHREAKLASRLTHSNTITVFDFGQTPDNYLFLVMEYLEGKSLRAVLKECGALHPGRAIHIASQICRSLSEAHGHAIVHRDIKPDNIFIIDRDDDPDFVKVLDFGIAKVLHSEEVDADLTAAGRIVGTPRYMAPEQVMSMPIDHRADIYSLGVIMYQMLTGTPPFDDASTPMLMMKHAHETPLDFSQRMSSHELLKMIPPGLERIVMKSLRKKPEDRQQSVDELRNELEMIRGSFGDPSVQMSGSYAPMPRGGSGPSHQMPALSAELVADPSNPSNPSDASFDTSPSHPSLEVGSDGSLVAQPSLALAIAPATMPPRVAQEEPKRSNVGLLAGGAVLLLLLLLAVAVGAGAIVATTMMPKGNPQPAVVAVPDTETKEKVPEPRRITIQSIPAGAEIRKNGAVVGTTPMAVELKHDDDKEYVYIVEKDGFISETKSFVASTLPEDGLTWTAKLMTAEPDPPDEKTDKGTDAGSDEKPVAAKATKRPPNRKKPNRRGTKKPAEKPKTETKVTETKVEKKRKPNIELLGGDDSPKKPKVKALE